MSKLTDLTASYTYGRVTVTATLPQRKTEYLKSRNFQCYPIIISADMKCDDDSLPVYNLKATYTERPLYQSYKIEHILTWNVSNYNITVRQMRELLVDMLPLVAALKHYQYSQFQTLVYAHPNVTVWNWRLVLASNPVQSVETAAVFGKLIMQN